MNCTKVQSASFPFSNQYLTIEEEAQICQQFKGKTWCRNKQVLWTGVPRQHAQKWADERDMQTLMMAMGPLMDPEHPLCLKSQKSEIAWRQYVKGPSAIFAWHIARGETVIVLTCPPPG